MAVPAATHMRPFAIGFADRTLVEPDGVDGTVLRDRDGGGLRPSICGAGGHTLRCMGRRRVNDEEHRRSSDYGEAATAPFQRAPVFGLHSIAGCHQLTLAFSDAQTLPVSRLANR